MTRLNFLLPSWPCDKVANRLFYTLYFSFPFPFYSTCFSTTYNFLWQSSQVGSAAKSSKTCCGDRWWGLSFIMRSAAPGKKAKVNGWEKGVWHGTTQLHNTCVVYHSNLIFCFQSKDPIDLLHEIDHQELCHHTSDVPFPDLNWFVETSGNSAH